MPPKKIMQIGESDIESDLDLDSDDSDLDVIPPAKVPAKEFDMTPREMIEKAMKTANDLKASMARTDAPPKPKKLRPEIEEMIIEAIGTGKIKIVLDVIKNNKKKFPSGMFAATVMGELRKMMDD
eukprot:GFYU01005285.1.p2 GENE.GFYU01005285.1~~GFYU01005285.1.p2  ORF type:complete len:125 (+),score=48.18 GFYU01005285.1:189-563(+)